MVLDPDKCKTAALSPVVCVLKKQGFKLDYFWAGFVCSARGYFTYRS